MAIVFGCNSKGNTHKAIMVIIFLYSVYHCQYYIQLWASHVKKNEEKLARVQRRAEKRKMFWKIRSMRKKLRKVRLFNVEMTDGDMRTD